MYVKYLSLFLVLLLMVVFVPGVNAIKIDGKYPIELNNDYWQRVLSDQEYHILKEKGTEPAFNNEYYYNNDKEILTKSNNNGGILGGLSTGAPIIIRTAIKPIASISRTQDTVNTETLKNTKIHIKGRHDSQILTRISPIINAVLNFAIMDLIYKEL